MSKQNLNGKVVVITGASSGFGKGAALEFAAAGAKVVLAARREQLIQSLARECRDAGGEAIDVPTDVSKPEDVQQLAHRAIAEFGGFDVWVNNAGAGAIGRFEDIPLPIHMQVLATDLLGTMAGSYYALQHFRERGSGILINVASVVGKVPAPYYSSYAAAKHGVVGLSAVLRQELEENNEKDIHVCTVMPTSMDTPFFEHAATYTGREAMPIPPVYDPKEVINVIVKLATEPEDEVSVGRAGKVFNFMHHFAPGMVESMMAKQTHKAEIEDAPPAENRTGSVPEPVETGTGVTGGFKK